MIDRPDKNTPKFPWFVTVSAHEPDAFFEKNVLNFYSPKVAG